MFDDDGHIWHSSGECLGINGGKLKKGQCATAELLVHMRSPCEIKHCPRWPTFGTVSTWNRTWAKLSLSHSEANTFTCGSFVICATACHCLAKSPSLPNYIDLSIRSTWRHKFVWNCSNWSWSATSAGNGRGSIPSSHLKQKPTRRLLSSCLPTYLRCLFYYMFYSCRLVWFFVQVLLYSRTCLCQNFVVPTCDIGYGLTKVWAYCRYARSLRESKITPTTRGVGWIMDISKMELWCAYWLVSYLQSNERAKIHMEAAPQKKNKSPSKPNVTSH